MDLYKEFPAHIIFMRRTFAVVAGVLALPVMLFWNLYTSSIDQALQPKLLLFAVGATLGMYGLSLAIVLPTEKDHEKQGVNAHVR